MTALPTPGTDSWRAKLDRFAAHSPDWVLMMPYFAYLLLLSLRDVGGPEWVWLFHTVRGVGSFAVIWLLWKHFPAWGKPHALLALLAGIACAALWVAGQHWFDSLGVPRRLPLPIFPGTPDPPEKIDPFLTLGGGWLTWATIVTRIGVATTAVPIVEELFWRAFLLRAFINWAEFDKIPLGTVHWRAFLFTSLISAIQHPDNWLVSVFCWFAFNGLMYWKKSILFLVLVHGFTNLVLYVYVVAYGDWIFW